MIPDDLVATYNSEEINRSLFTDTYGISEEGVYAVVEQLKQASPGRCVTNGDAEQYLREYQAQDTLSTSGPAGMDLPVPGRFIIRVWNCRAAVSRHEGDPAKEIITVEAANWQDLEDDALEEVEEQGGAINMSGHYACSAQLAARAQFKEG